MVTANKPKKIIIKKSTIHDTNPINIFDTWHKWTNKSKNANFKSDTRCIGNGEKKLSYELDVNINIGGQNNVVDLVHNVLGNISVKDMTNDDCILGAEGCQNMRELFRKIVYPFVNWCEKYKGECKYANDFYEQMNKSYGRSKMTIIEGVDRFELSNSNLTTLNNILNKAKNIQMKNMHSTNSEYFRDVCKELHNNSFIEKCNNCVRREAIDLILIIVHKNKGWMIVRDLEKITCPRITRGAPRINVCF